MSGQVFLGWTSTKQGLMCFAQGHNAVTRMRLEPTTSQSRDKHSSTVSDFIWDFRKLPFPSHLGKYFDKIGKIGAKYMKLGK